MCRITLKRSRDDEISSSSSSSSSSDSGSPCSSTHSHANIHKRVRCIMSELPDRMRIKPLDEQCHPDLTVKVLNPSSCTLHNFDSPLLLQNIKFFHPPTPTEIAAYDQTVMSAVRNNDFDTLRSFHSSGRTLKCSNKFGESLLHLACRKGMVEMTRFLVEECNVPLQVCDDFGRNPLHDACWTAEPNFDLVDFILSKCPDLMYIKDRRGSTPFQYIRRPQWKQYNAFLLRKGGDFVKPKQLNC